MAAAQPEWVEQEEEEIQSKTGQGNTTQQQQGLRKTRIPVTFKISAEVTDGLVQSHGFEGTESLPTHRTFTE